MWAGRIWKKKEGTYRNQMEKSTHTPKKFMAIRKVYHQNEYVG